MTIRVGTAGHDGYVQGGPVAPGGVVRLEAGQTVTPIGGGLLLLPDSVSAEPECDCEPECTEVRSWEGVVARHVEHERHCATRADDPFVAELIAAMRREITDGPYPVGPAPAVIESDPDLIDTIGGPSFDWPRLLHPVMRWLLGPRAFASWCLWRHSRQDPVPPPTTNPPRTIRPNPGRAERY